MSVILFELKDEHLKLLKFLRWSLNDKKLIISTEDVNEEPAPFGENNIYDGIDLILKGKPSDFNPLTTEEIRVYTKEEKEKMDKLYEELPMALDVILYNGHFDLGMYSTRFHDRQWKKKNI